VRQPTSWVSVHVVGQAQFRADSGALVITESASRSATQNPRYCYVLRALNCDYCHSIFLQVASMSIAQRFTCMLALTLVQVANCTHKKHHNASLLNVVRARVGARRARSAVVLAGSQ
jgi:hypothetical protein